MIIKEEDYLEHFGVKGQQWGVRKKSSSYLTEQGRQVAGSILSEHGARSMASLPPMSTYETVKYSQHWPTILKVLEKAVKLTE